MNELKLIVSLFDQEVRHTIKYLTSLKDKDWGLLSQPWDSFLFHGFTKNVSLRDILIHIVMLEQHVIDSIGSMADGDVLATEGEDNLCEHRDNEALIACYKSVHEEHIGKMGSFRPSDLDKQLTFLGQRYSGIGLLWMLTGHHAFHLGQLRSMDFSPSSQRFAS